jgi:tRNA-dihydrouridine synthase A
MLKAVSVSLVATSSTPTACGSLLIPSEREVFSVAPMMGHTNRHYHSFFRLLSKRTHLYTEMMPASQIVNLYESNPDALDELLRFNADAHPIVLQVGGGRDADALARAAAIGAEFGYDGINLNCGCPSNAVSGRSGGASLMRDPSHVAMIVERMSAALEPYPHVDLSIKHRLGVADAADYNADYDRQQDDSAALSSCLTFVRAVAFNGSVKKLHVHGRIALLGDFEPTEGKSSSSLWVPGESPEENDRKVDHKRLQYHAKRKSRLATIKNRSVPPLRPNVVNELATAVPGIEFVTNGGMNTMEDVRDRLVSGTNVVGAMVGRAVINHPCSFSTADTLWGDQRPNLATRQQVLETFADYCALEEERLKSLGRSQAFIEALRRRMVAVPFTLFAGEVGNNSFQRRVRKLISRPDRHSARSILLAAMMEVPTETLQNPVSEYSLEMESYSEFNPKSGPLQRSIL